MAQAAGASPPARTTTQSRDLVLHTVLDSRRSLRDIAERLQDCPAAALAVMREANRSSGSLSEPATTLERHSTVSA